MFYIDQYQTCSFAELINRLNAIDKVVPNLHRFNVLDYFINLIAGVASGVDLVLLDNDFSLDEIEHLTGRTYKESEVLIPMLKLENFQDLVQRVINSPSTISLFTSGTTGKPKIINHSLDSLTRNIKIDKRFSGNVWGFAYNPTHMAGLQVFFQAFFNGNTIVNIFGLAKQDIFRSIKQYSITNISASPTFYRLLLPTIEIYLTVNQITFGGEKSDKLLHQKVQSVFPNAKIRNVYASTEAGALFASKDDSFVIPEEIKDKITVKDGELLIHLSLLGNIGEIHLGNPWYATGDLIEYTDENQLEFRILARKNEMINVGGYKVNPDEVESALRRMSGVKDCKVYGVPNSVLGNILCADIVLVDEIITEPDIKKFLASSVQNYKVPRKIFFKKSIPISRNGKIERKNANK
jgi:acyl-coenzyme A synthetase/AMP-(fatty) acid ligase